ncbi:MAG: zinc-binding dehydrogenase [Oscillospiraceae bacterium]|nr:zinc-binding dehydrogenase [Oscillospiraceae bacterium]
MKTRAVRLYGEMDLRLEEFDLPEMKEDEILAKVISDSLCASTYKAAKQGSAHKRVPADVAENPVMVGHEFCGEIVKVGSKWADEFKTGDRFIIQPALNYKGSLDAPGYSYRYIGGDATYIVIPNEVMEMNCLIPYDGDSFFAGSMTEPYSCVIGTFHAMYHTKYGSYVHHMGIREGGKMIMLAGNGPMGQAAIDYILHCDRRPSMLVVTGRRQEQLDRLAQLLTVEDAAANGISLHYFNTVACEDAKAELLALTGGTGYDDVLVFTPVASMVELGDELLANDGCLNFFSGPSDKNFKAQFNFYNVHYAATHIVGTSGGNTEDMKEAVAMMNEGKINPSILVSHIGGLDAVPEATKHLPEIPGSKKLIYTGIRLPLTAIADFEKLGKDDPFFAKLDELCKANHGLWSAEAEKYLLETKAQN